ncbi:4'-phosphopantetheinyl transferase family protein [Streptomyces sp. B21-083]|uniref:4'-phosphopantetheinyl transferase family protein n=1 Tax=Streptomyces sp. B21-083 TaxID=3039410 RepID=UPI002FF3C9AA
MTKNIDATQGGLLRGLFPSGVEAVDDFGDSGPAAAMALHPEEVGLINQVLAERRREFTTVRGCARLALTALGLPAAPLLPGHRGAPRWPEGAVGSMTHCQGYRAAAVGHAFRFRALGIDAEPDEPLPRAVAAKVMSPEERARLTRMTSHDATIAWDRLLFCVKETVYKVWSPLAGSWLGYEDADVQLRPDGTFTARILVPARTADGVRLEGLETLTGRWRAARGLLLSAIALPNSPRPQGD